MARCEERQGKAREKEMMRAEGGRLLALSLIKA